MDLVVCINQGSHLFQPQALFQHFDNLRIVEFTKYKIGEEKHAAMSRLTGLIFDAIKLNIICRQKLSVFQESVNVK